jgi:ribosomal protein S1
MATKKTPATEEPLAPVDTEPILAAEPQLELGSTTQRPGRVRDNDLITLNDQERALTAEASEAAKWNYLAGAAHRHQILSGIMGAVEPPKNGSQSAVIDFEGIRVLVPIHEMLLDEWPDGAPTPVPVSIKLQRMLGATVDFLPLGVDIRNHAAVGSRKSALLERQKHYYATGRVQPGIRIACRVIGVGNNAVTVEAAGVESVINARDVSHDWYADVASKYASGDLVVAKVLSVGHDEETDQYSVKLSIKDAEENTSRANLRKLVPGSNYFGEVTGVKSGTIFVRLQTGCNAKTRLYRTKEIPSKFDTVSFHVNSVDEENGVALGLITRIIKRHSRLM